MKCAKHVRQQKYVHGDGYLRKRYYIIKKVVLLHFNIP